MPSSILRFRDRVPWTALRLLTVAVLAWAASAVYALFLNPEIAFFKHCARVKHCWAEKLDREYGHKIVVFGGSSCGVSIDGERMLERHGLPTVNLGMGAGMGAEVLTRYALLEVHQGDTLIMVLEPDLLTRSTEPTALGAQFSLAIGKPGLLKSSPSFTWLPTLLSLRPGGYHFFTLIGKMARGGPLYRYHFNDIHASGWQEITIKRDLTGPPVRGPALSPDARQLLGWLRSWCVANKVRLAYSLPWGYSPRDNVQQFEAENLDFLLQISRFLPVLKDPALGADTRREQFADTEWHLTPDAAALRTDALAREIEEWSVWTTEELQQMASQRNRSDGTKTR
jgi:hypothetical protein